MTPAPIDTTLTARLGLRYPVIQAGMSWVSSCWQLPVAVSEAGGLGVVALGPVRLAEVAGLLTELRARTARAWAANLPLYRKQVDEVMSLLLESPPPVLIASQGGPRRYLERFQDAGTVCLHVVASVEHAVKAAEAGVDGLVVVGGEAGGHPPSGMVSSLVLTRRIAQELPEVPLISSGGYADGHGLAAGLALGASAVQFGTRFIASEEARVHPAYQRMVVDSDVDDSLTVGRQLGVIRVLRNQFAETMAALESAGAPLQERETLFHASSLRGAAVDGDVQLGKVEAGQSAGLVGEVLPATEIVHAIASEYWSAYRGMPDGDPSGARLPAGHRIAER